MNFRGKLYPQDANEFQTSNIDRVRGESFSGGKIIFAVQGQESGCIK